MTKPKAAAAKKPARKPAPKRPAAGKPGWAEELPVRELEVMGAPYNPRTGQTAEKVAGG